MKKILILIKGLGRGGAEQLLVNAAPHLDREDFAYQVAYLVPEKDALAADLVAAGIPVRCLDGERGAGWVPRLRRMVLQDEIDLVHAHLPYAAIGARIALPRRRRPPIVYTEHNVWDSYRRPTYLANLLTFPRNDHVFAVSEHVRASIRSPLPLPMPPMETLYHGPDSETLVRWGSSDGVRAELGIPADAPLIGTVANFRHEKGHDFLLRAHAKVRRSLPDTRLVLVGTGPLEGDLRRLVRELDLGDSVVFAGARADAPRLAGAFDVFALASVYEGLSIALIEAMANGRASVVTSVGGLREVVHDGREALVVRPGDADALADGIVMLLRDDALRDRLGAAARERSLHFDIRKAVTRIEAVYRELLR